MGKLIDISPLISPDIAVWPGDRSFSHEYLCRIADGANLDLSSIHTTVHVGAHADAPSHYDHPSEGIHERSLSYYYGLTQLMIVSVPRGERIYPKDLPEDILAPRLLLCTGSFPNPNNFNTDFNSLSPALVDYAADRGVILIGIDTPSIDPFHSKKLESHKRVLHHDLAILEGIVCKDVPSGMYRLMAFPLKIQGADASPVRAVLEELY
ncbi:MAG: cyclase family protein [Myxococcota bacterium]|nr:cyclase family protein [Myxococcota bacterium]